MDHGYDLIDRNLSHINQLAPTLIHAIEIIFTKKKLSMFQKIITVPLFFIKIIFIYNYTFDINN